MGNCDSNRILAFLDDTKRSSSVDRRRRRTFSNVMHDTGTSGWIHDLFIVSQVEEIVATIEASVPVNMIQLEILKDNAVVFLVNEDFLRDVRRCVHVVCCLDAMHRPARWSFVLH